MSTFDLRGFRNACGLFATGVNVITTRIEGRDHGMTANAFMSISLDPPLIAISIAERAKMLPLIQSSGRFAVSTLPYGSEKLARHFAGKPDPELKRLFRDFDGLPVVLGAVTVFAADVVQQVLVGDHTIFIGHVSHMEMDADAEPLLFHKGKFGRIATEQSTSLELCDFMGELVW